MKVAVEFDDGRALRADEAARPFRVIILQLEMRPHRAISRHPPLFHVGKFDERDPRRD